MRHSESHSARAGREHDGGGRQERLRIMGERMGARHTSSATRQHPFIQYTVYMLQVKLVVAKHSERWAGGDEVYHDILNTQIMASAAQHRLSNERFYVIQSWRVMVLSGIPQSRIMTVATSPLTKLSGRRATAAPSAAKNHESIQQQSL